MAAIAKVSGAPAGTLYHRFGNRNGVVTAAWLRALERFQGRVLATAAGDPTDEAVAMAVAAVGFARDLPETPASCWRCAPTTWSTAFPIPRCSRRSRP